MPPLTSTAPSSNTRAVAYVRVSTEEQATSGLSLEVQRMELIEYAARNKIDIVEIVADNGISAKNMRDRPGMQRVLAMLTSNEADAVLVAKLDRLSRNPEDMEHLLSNYFGGSETSLKKELLSVGNPVDVRTAGGRLTFRIQVAVDAHEREVIGERTSKALKHISKPVHLGGRGKKVGGAAIAMDSLERSTIDTIVRLDKEGYSARRIAEQLTNEGLRGRRGGKWEHVQVRAVLEMVAEQGSPATAESVEGEGS